MDQFLVSGGEEFLKECGGFKWESLVTLLKDRRDEGKVVLKKNDVAT